MLTKCADRLTTLVRVSRNKLFGLVVPSHPGKTCLVSETGTVIPLLLLLPLGDHPWLWECSVCGASGLCPPPPPSSPHMTSATLLFGALRKIVRTIRWQ